MQSNIHDQSYVESLEIKMEREKGLVAFQQNQEKKKGRS